MVVLVFHSEYPTPAAKITNVTPSDHLGGNFSRPIRSATNTFEQMNTNSPARAYFR